MLIIRDKAECWQEQIRILHLIIVESDAPDAEIDGEKIYE